MSHTEDESTDLNLGRSASRELLRMEEERECGMGRLKMTEELIVSKESIMKNRSV